MDPTGSEFIDIAGILLVYTNASEGPSDISTLRGIRISLEASFDMKCDRNYYGSQCDIFCQSRDSYLYYFSIPHAVLSILNSLHVRVIKHMHLKSANVFILGNSDKEFYSQLLKLSSPVM